MFWAIPPHEIRSGILNSFSHFGVPPDPQSEFLLITKTVVSQFFNGICHGDAPQNVHALLSTEEG